MGHANTGDDMNIDTSNRYEQCNMIGHGDAFTGGIYLCHDYSTDWICSHLNRADLLVGS